ncbi:MAG: integrase arm-type DNA-binding domain-containing protein [Burkholderiales bacterium]|jgi:integrase|nr:integrase arm-type DNA-binding domain-containing protein [Burkholderiales bacterium]
MPKLATEMGALTISRVKKPGLYFVGFVTGLALQVKGTGSKSWILRSVIGGRRRDMGLGAYPSVSLALARQKASEARELIRQGVDPIERQRSALSALKASLASQLTFEETAKAYMSAHETTWKNAKHAQQWRNTLKEYAYPAFGDILVRDIEKEHVLAALRPIWNSKNETASRLRGRIELVLSYAMQAGYRPEGLNPARWKGGLDKLLAAPSKVQKTSHFKALAAKEISEFFKKLAQVEGQGARALEFAILTAARSGEVRGATWSEFDIRGKMWTIPAARMKAGKEHRVPLSNPAIKLLESLAVTESELVFPSPRGGTLSDMTLTGVLRRMKVGVTAHGFRSTFRDWVAESTSFPNEVAEMALAHTISNKSEASYRRGDMFEKRAVLMEQWSKFVYTPTLPTTVHPINAAKVA